MSLKKSKLDLLVRVRYLNPLPAPPCPPKLLDVPTNPMRYARPEFLDGIGNNSPLPMIVDAEIYIFEADQIRTVTVSGRTGEILNVPTHWHEKHDEVISVLRGQLNVTIGAEVKVCTAETGEVFIPRGLPHALQTLEGVPCVFTEKTNPTDFDTKELFFRNIFAISGLGGRGGLLSIMQIFYHGDMYPVFPVVHSMWMEKAFVTLLGGYIAPCLGYSLKYKKLRKID